MWFRGIGFCGLSCCVSTDELSLVSEMCFCGGFRGWGSVVGIPKKISVGSDGCGWSVWIWDFPGLCLFWASTRVQLPRYKRGLVFFVCVWSLKAPCEQVFPSYVGKYPYNFLKVNQNSKWLCKSASLLMKGHVTLCKRPSSLSNTLVEWTPCNGIHDGEKNHEVMGAVPFVVSFFGGLLLVNRARRGRGGGGAYRQI